MSYPNFWVLKLEWVMIYFIFLACLALVTCYLACHWRNRTEFRLRKQLVNLSTRWLVHLPCYSVFDTSNLFTRPLVDLSTYHVTLSFIYPVYKQLVNLSTCSLVHLPCYFVSFRKQLVDLSTCLLVHLSTFQQKNFTTLHFQ